MKTCFNCGKILDDSASFCTGCGTSMAAAPVAPQQPMYQAPYVPAPAPTPIPDAPISPEKKAPTWLCVLNLINSIISTFALFFAGLSFCDMNIHVSTSASYRSSYSIYSSISDYTPRFSTSAWSSPDEGLMATGMIFAIAAFVLAIVTLILTATKRLGAERVLKRVSNLVFLTMLMIFTMCGLGM